MGDLKRLPVKSEKEIEEAKNRFLKVVKARAQAKREAPLKNKQLRIALLEFVKAA